MTSQEYLDEVNQIVVEPQQIVELLNQLPQKSSASGFGELNMTSITLRFSSDKPRPQPSIEGAARLRLLALFQFLGTTEAQAANLVASASRGWTLCPLLEVAANQPLQMLGSSVGFEPMAFVQRVTSLGQQP